MAPYICGEFTVILLVSFNSPSNPGCRHCFSHFAYMMCKNYYCEWELSRTYLLFQITKDNPPVQAQFLSFFSLLEIENSFSKQAHTDMLRMRKSGWKSFIGYSPENGRKSSGKEDGKERYWSRCGCEGRRILVYVMDSVFASSLTSFERCDQLIEFLFIIFACRTVLFHHITLKLLALLRMFMCREYKWPSANPDLLI